MILIGITFSLKYIYIWITSSEPLCENIESIFRCLKFLFCLMSSSTFASSSCLFAFYFNDIGYKEPQNTYKKRIFPTVFSIQFSICFILPQQAHLFSLISSSVESASGHVRYSMYVHVIHHCVDTNYFP